jgi:predicted metalloprotease with PDZ domain
MTHYRVRVRPGTFDLEISVRAPAGPARLEIPTWVPGAYGFMKYARDVISLQPPLERDGWSGWRAPAGPDEISVEYTAASGDPSLGELAGIVDRDFAVLLGTRYLKAGDGPCRVTYDVPAGWDFHHPAGATKIDDKTWEYPSYAALVDTPVVCGRSLKIFTREVRGVPFHHIFLEDAVGLAEGVEKLLDELVKIAGAAGDLFGGFPFTSYTYVFSTSPQAHWGLEHANATMISLGPDAFVDPEARNDAWRVCAHELVHAWNVCRLKPAPLGKLDLVRGSFSDGLWVAEGFTRYWEFVLCARAGLIPPGDVLSNIVNYARHLSDRPATRRTSAVDSSRATFLNHSRYPGAINSSIDYYDAGMLHAFAIDAALRAKGSSLDQRFAAFYKEKVDQQGEGWTMSELEAALGEVVAGAKAPNAPAWAWSALASLGFELENEDVPTLGIVLDKGGPAIGDVLDTFPTGLRAGDVIASVNGFAFSAKALSWLVAHERQLKIVVTRGHQLLQLVCPIGMRTRATKLLWKGTPAQAEAIARWLGAPFAPAAGESLSLASYRNFHGVVTVI